MRMQIGNFLMGMGAVFLVVQLTVIADALWRLCSP